MLVNYTSHTPYFEKYINKQPKLYTCTLINDQLPD